MNLATGPFDMLFNHGGWREFLEASGPHLALMILCGVGLMVILWGTAKERPGLVLLGLSLGGLPLLAL
ncbi:hypothetical protein, partial [Alcaligenes faecalis]